MHDVEEIEEKNICTRCIGDAYLQEKIDVQEVIKPCDYCSSEDDPTISMSELASLIDSAFQRHYRQSADQPDGFQLAMMKDKESTYDWEPDGEPVVYAIMNAADIPEDAAQDIQALLAEEYYDHEMAKMSEPTHYDSEAYYDEKGPDDQEWLHEWRYFEKHLKSDTRFNSRLILERLDKIFDGIENYGTHDGKSVIVKTDEVEGFGTFFRARVFQDDDGLEKALLNPAKELGPPPPAIAQAGRMNAHGISVFYGATSIDAAIAEVRPPVGSRAAVAEFSVRRQDICLSLSVL